MSKRPKVRQLATRTLAMAAVTVAIAACAAPHPGPHHPHQQHHHQQQQGQPPQQQQQQQGQPPQQQQHQQHHQQQGQPPQQQHGPHGAHVQAGPHGDHRHDGPVGHRFQNAEKWAKHFENPARARWQRPEAVLDLLQITPTMRIADIGSGTGYFAVRMARRASQGKVWGIDIEPSMVDYLNKRAARERLTNLESRLGQTNDPRLPEAVDLVFICDTYHHIGGREGYFRRVAARLRPHGRLAIVDFFKHKRLPVGPPAAQRVAAATVDDELSRAGFRRVGLDTTTLPYQYVAIYSLK